MFILKIYANHFLARVNNLYIYVTSGFSDFFSCNIPCWHCIFPACGLYFFPVIVVILFGHTSICILRKFAHLIAIYMQQQQQAYILQAPIFTIYKHIYTHTYLYTLAHINVSVCLLRTSN